MRKRKALLVISLVLVLLGISAWQCGGVGTTPPPCPTCSPCPPTPTLPDTSAVETQLASCEATLTAIVGEGAEVEEAEEPSPPPTVWCPEAISCEDAKANVGEVKTVQGKVVDTHFASNSSGQPTFLNLCYPYGDSRRFTALIWGENRQKFIDCLGGPPEQVLLNREVCVEGLIEIYEGIPEIILTECGQLTLIQ